MKTIFKTIVLSLLFTISGNAMVSTKNDLSTYVHRPVLIKSAVGNKYLTVNSNEYKGGYNVSIHENKRDKSQVFYVTRNTDNETFWINQYTTSNHLHVHKSNRNPNAKVTMWKKWVNQDNLKWTFEYAGDGYFYIKSQLGTYLDVYNAVDANGTAVQTYTRNPGDAQKWKFETPDHFNTSYRLGLTFKTGDDDLRGGHDNVHVTIFYRNGTNENHLNVNKKKSWDKNSKNHAWIYLLNNHPFSDIVKIRIQTTFGGGLFGDNWNLNGIRITEVANNKDVLRSERIFGNMSGETRLFRFTGDKKVLDLDL